MKKYLSANVFEEVLKAQKEKSPLEPELIDEVANAVHEWGKSHGVTHYTHAFQPLSGTFGEKHDAWLKPKSGRVISEFKGKSLISAEPDASSFPNGGLRATHQARGNVIWDPSSPMHISNLGHGTSTLRIPSIFMGWNGKALDHKTPLLRSLYYLEKATVNALAATGDSGHKSAHADCGLEQEFFLVDEKFAQARPDIIASGRTLLGRDPFRGQAHSDKYYSYASSRVLDCVAEMEKELWRLGIPSVTRHAEVSPAQYEMAPVFETANVAIDNNMHQMFIMEEVAKRHGLYVLLHEKPFANLNGSGKHNNWSFGTNKIPTLFEPTNPHFMLTLAAFIRACNINGDLLRISVATSGNDHRLGGHEAPPGIMSIYLGDDVIQMVQQAIRGETPVPHVEKDFQDFGVPHLPRFKRQSTDRNRTSPIAFTGNKFEFRAVGASQNPSHSTMVLNTIMGESMQYMADEINKARQSGASDPVKKVVTRVLAENERVIFNGDNYSEEWRNEAARRGLLNLKDTVSALKHYNTDKNTALFKKSGVLAGDELSARRVVYYDNFNNDVKVELRTVIDLVNTCVIPSTLAYQQRLFQAVNELNSSVLKTKHDELKVQLEGVISAVTKAEKLNEEVEKLEDVESVAEFLQTQVRPQLETVRNHSDRLEGLVDQDFWKLPSYSMMLFYGH